MQARQQKLVDYITSHQALSALPLLHVRYEDLQSRPATVMQVRTRSVLDCQVRALTLSSQDVRQFLAPAVDSVVMAVPSPRLRPHSAQGSQWVKRSSERLSTVLRSYSAVHAALSAHPQCSGLLQQLAEEGHRVFADGGGVDECCRRVL